MDKTQFIQRTGQAIISLAILQETIAGLSGVYVDRGMNPGATNAITDQDLIDAGVTTMTAAEFNANAISVLGDYLVFCDGTAALPAVKRKTKLNIARGDF